MTNEVKQITMSISRWIIVDENGGFIVCCIYWDRKAYVYEGG